MDNITCRGSFALGTACGKCSKCLEEINRHNAVVKMREALNPPTTAQIMAHPKVLALVEALKCADYAFSGANMDMRALERKINAALAALEDKP